MFSIVERVRASHVAPKSIVTSCISLLEMKSIESRSMARMFSIVERGRASHVAPKSIVTTCISLLEMKSIESRSLSQNVFHCGAGASVPCCPKVYRYYLYIAIGNEVHRESLSGPECLPLWSECERPTLTKRLTLLP
ncbi:hypothetical protein J6590_103330, partial [Homalodisca vitripennis]